MGGHWYLISSLPSPQFGSPPPLNHGEFVSYCARVDPDMAAAAAELSLVPPARPRAASDILSRFWARETRLRNELVRARATRIGKGGETWIRGEEPGADGAELSAIVAAALKIDDPLEAELFLERSRWDWLGSQTALGAFSDDAVLAYGLKILILERLSRFREEAGRAEYKRVYDAVLGAAAQDGVA